MNSIWLRGFLGVALALVVVPLLLLAAVIYILWGLLLRLLVIVLWIPRGHRVLVVYSNSPHWKQRFEERILPRLGPRCVVLNWLNGDDGLLAWRSAYFGSMAAQKITTHWQS